MKDTCSVSEVLRCIHVALLCVQDLAYNRPDISLVIKMITSENPSLPMPRQPTLTFQGYSSETSTTKTMERRDESMSTFDVTITRIQSNQGHNGKIGDNFG
jgi:hypothetical protein